MRRIQAAQGPDSGGGRGIPGRTGECGSRGHERRRDSKQSWRVLPELDRDDRYFWQPFAERLQHRFDGVPGTDGTGSFVDECLRAGARAVPVMRRNRLWQKDAPDVSNKRARRIYELRIRLGLFYAASMRCLVQGVSRLRVRCGEAAWQGVSEEGQSFSEFAAGQDGRVEVEWTHAAPDFGKTCLVMQVFFTAEEALLLSPELAEEVYNHVGPAGPSGLFGLMLVADGQAEKPSVDVCPGLPARAWRRGRPQGPQGQHEDGRPRVHHA